MALSSASDEDLAARADSVAARLRIGGSASSYRTPSLSLIWWGLAGDPTDAIILCRGARWRDEPLTPERTKSMLLGSARRELADALPPFGAFAVERDSVIAATDAIGYRHLYVRRGRGWVALSTSLRALALIEAAQPDPEAWAVQSLLGWQLGQRTVIGGIEKLPARHSVTVERGRVTIEPYADADQPPHVDGDEAVVQAASLLRSYVDRYLDDRPDATLQLSGGQDSRILLSAIEPRRRRGLAALTLQVAGSDDAPIAAEIARREGLVHRVISMDGLADLDPERAFTMCLAASRSIGYMANPLATAALVFADSAADSGPRIAGLGGEVARGFYYAGPTVSWPITHRFADALGRWRLFTNESVPTGVLAPSFAAWARQFTTDQILAELRATGCPAWAATDEFYLYQRMQRWAGVTDSAACFVREMVNPMLDRRFLDIARGMHPRDKRGSRFLGRLQLALDVDLSRIPLEGRPPPEVFARTGPSALWSRSVLAAGKTVRKVRQRLQHASKPPAGVQVLAAAVTRHWRAQPDCLTVVAGVDFVDSSWIDQMLSGTVEPEPAAVAFVFNLATALTDTASSPHRAD